MKEIYQSGEYAQVNPTWHAEDSPWKVGQILRMFKKHSLHPKSIAEIGCGAGEILLLLHNALPDCPEFHGFDIAPLPIEMAKKKETPRLHFHNEDLLKSPQVFDLLLIIDVVEHVPDYLTFLAQCQQKAKLKLYHIPLEIHVSSTIRGTISRAREDVGHIHYFSTETAIASLKDTGHKIVDYLYTPGALGLAALHPSFKRSIANIPRRLVSLFSETYSARLFGGQSLLVLAE